MTFTDRNLHVVAVCELGVLSLLMCSYVMSPTSSGDMRASLPQVYFLYQYSLRFFLDIFQVVLSGNPNLRGMVDYGKRLGIITRDLFQVCVESVYVIWCGMCAHACKNMYKTMNLTIVVTFLLCSLSLPLPQTVYNRVAQGMLHDDRIVLAILLCRIHLRGVPE